MPLAAQQSDDGFLDRGRFSGGLSLDVTVVGASVGLRPEILYRPFSPDGSSHLRLAIGAMPGLEFFFIPVNFGWRQIFRRDARFQPLFGAGYEHQFFLISDAANVQRGALYLEIGADFWIQGSSHLGLNLAADLAPFTRFGFGAVARLNYRMDF